MKKSLFFIGAMAVLMASCSQENEFAPKASKADNAIEFDVYSYDNVISKGAQTTVNEFKTNGIGVFAFYQPANNGIAGPDFTTIKYPTPNFMYNQEVTLTAGKWSYTPLKYWPNNENDKISFFAYAPYADNTPWEALGITTDATGKAISKSFVIYNTLKDQVDYLVAQPQVNKTKPSTIFQSGDSICFNFKHALSKVNLYVGVLTDSLNNNKTTSSLTAAGVPDSWTDESTTIAIKSIEFKDLYETYTYTWNGSETAEGEGKQSIKIIPSANDNADLITKDTWNTPKWHNVFGNTGTGDSTFMFIAPQEFNDEEIVITYVVTSGEGVNQSVITNVVTKKWSNFRNEVLASTTLEAGKQYKLYFLIGMQSVKLKAEVTDWADATSHVIDVPVAEGF